MGDNEESSVSDLDIDFVNPEEVEKVSWEDLVGIETQIKKIKNILTDFQYFPQLGKPTGILLYGPPGWFFTVTSNFLAAKKQLYKSKGDCVRPSVCVSSS